MLYHLCQRGTKTKPFGGKGYVKSLFNSGLVRTNLSFSHRFDAFSHPCYEHKLHCFYVINYISLGNNKKEKKESVRRDHWGCNQKCDNKVIFRWEYENDCRILIQLFSQSPHPSKLVTSWIARLLTWDQGNTYSWSSKKKNRLLSILWVVMLFFFYGVGARCPLYSEKAMAVKRNNREYKH